MNTILIVDDHASFRLTVRALLEADDFVVVGEADGAAGAVTAARALRPEVALLDIGLAGTDGFEVAGTLRAEHPELRIALTSSHDAASFGPKLKESGLPFLPKDEISGRAIRALFVPA